MRVLVIEDDVDIARHIESGLRDAGVECVHIGDAEAGLRTARAGGFDVLVVDRMMPKGDGLSLVRDLRAGGDATPILFLSALGDVEARVEGLRAGGDDYLAKPFAFAELLARVEALARRREGATLVTLADLEIDLVARQARRAEQVLDLQPREFDLLAYFMQRAGATITRKMLLEDIWQLHFDPQTNIIDVHISRLRAKIDKGFDRPLLHTIRGTGFVMEARD